MLHAVLGARAERAPDLPGRHRTLSLRQPVAGDRHALRAGERRLPGRAASQAAGHRLQHGHRRCARDAAGARVGAGDRRRRARRPGGGPGDPQRPRRRHRHRGGDRLRRLHARAAGARPASSSCSRAPCPLFVPLAEEGWTEGPVARSVAETYLASLARSGIDTLILGCTHYPLLKPLIAEVMGPSVTLVDSAEETAREVAARLRSRRDRAGERSGLDQLLRHRRARPLRPHRPALPGRARRVGGTHRPRLSLGRAGPAHGGVCPSASMWGTHLIRRRHRAHGRACPRKMVDSFTAPPRSARASSSSRRRRSFR